MTGRIGQALAQVAHLLDPTIGGGVDLEHIEGRAFADRDARVADIARVAIAQVRAIDGLREDPGERRLAGPARTDEQDRVRDALGPHGVAERLDDRFLADDLAEGLGTPASVQRLVRDGRGHDLLRSRASGIVNAVHPPSIIRWLVPTVTGGSDQAVPRHPTNIA